MAEHIEEYFKMLEKLTDEELDRSTREIALHGKQNEARSIANIAEVAERELHLKLGYKNLFEYCSIGLNYSEGSVFRRTQVAGICRRYPAILEALFSGRLHLTGASLIAPHLTDDNVEEVIAKAEGKTRRELENYLVTLAPKKEFAPSVRKQPVREPAMLEDNTKAGTSEEGNRAEQAVSPSRGQRTRDLVEPATEERYNFRFSAAKEFTEKFDRLAEVLGVECPHRRLEDVFGRALEIALDKKDPKRKLERRRKREARKQAARPGDAACVDEVARIAEAACVGEIACEGEAACPDEAARPGDVARAGEATCVREAACEGEAACGGEEVKIDEMVGRAAVSRYIPAEVRERVMERAGYQCEYCGPDGTRCSCRTGLQIEHTKPFAVFQTHDEDSLRVLCPAHNLFAAKGYYGLEFVQQKIEAARRESGKRSALPQSAPAR